MGTANGVITGNFPLAGNTYTRRVILYNRTRRLKSYRLEVDTDFCTEDELLNTGVADIASVP